MNKTAQVYLWIVIGMALLGILNNILILFHQAVIATVTAVLTLIFVLFNVVSIPVFLVQRQAKQVLILPIYFVVSYLALSIIAIISKDFILRMVNLEIAIAFLAGIFEIGLSVYLLKAADPATLSNEQLSAL